VLDQYGPNALKSKHLASLGLKGLKTHIWSCQPWY